MLIDLVSTRIDRIAYNRDSLSVDKDPDVEIIFSALEFSRESALRDNIAFVTLDRGFKDKIAPIARRLRKKSEPSQRIFLYEIDRCLESYRVLYIHN
ncbi:hypothetical protein HYT57_00955 [Candidatus Woesearchaeota archaeon]|nr:hypothetical protein [Candidatus Woesearchaeota archaeon]